MAFKPVDHMLLKQFLLPEIQKWEHVLRLTQEVTPITVYLVEHQKLIGLALKTQISDQDLISNSDLLTL